MAVADHAFAIDQEGLGRAVHTKIDAEAAILVENAVLEWIAVQFEPVEGEWLAVLVIDAHHGKLAFLGQPHQGGMLNEAGQAIAAPDIEQEHPPGQIGVVHGFIRQIGHGESRHGFVDQHRGQFGGVEIEPAPEKDREQEEGRGRNEEKWLVHASPPAAGRKPPRPDACPVSSRVSSRALSRGLAVASLR